MFQWEQERLSGCPQVYLWCDQQHTLIETMKKASAHDFSKLMISSQCFQGTFIPQKPNKQHKPQSLDHMSYLGIGINGHSDIS